MKNLALIIASIICFSAFGQEPTTPTSSNIKIGINFSPDITYRRLVVRDEQFPSDHLIKEYRDRNEVPSIGFTTGFNTLFNLSDRFELATGLQYALKGYGTKNIIDPMSIEDAIQYNTTYKDNQILVPVKLNYKIGEGRLKVLPGVGFSVNHTFERTSTTRVFDEKGEMVGKYHNTFTNSHYDASLLMSLGVDYDLKGRTSVRLEPTFRYDILNRSIGSLQMHLWNAGLNFGYYYSLK